MKIAILIIACALVLTAIECLILHIRVSELEIQLLQLRRQSESQ